MHRMTSFIGVILYDMLEWIKQLDTALFFFLNGKCANGLFDIIMPVITQRTYVIVLPFLLLFLIKEREKALIVFAVSFFSILLADATAHALKEIIGRERPCNVLDHVHLLAGCSRSFSLPSSHATNAFAFAVPFLFMSRGRLRYIFLSVAVLVSLSRVFVGVHYPFDVVAGAAAGSFSGISVVFIYRWAEKRFCERPYTTVLYVFLLVLSIFRIYFILYGPLGLGPDEAHYWEWSRRLDLSYYSKGPMIAYLIAAGTALFGDNVFGVRVLAVVCSLLSSLVLYRLGKEMFDERVGTASAVLFQLIPLYAVFGVIFTIDSPFILFWIVSLYLFSKAINNSPVPSNKSPRQRFTKGREGAITWIFLGIAVGFGLLTKYTMAFFYVCSLLFIISSGKRKILKTAGPYVSFVISLIIFSPVVIWNVSHDWVTLRHTAGQAHVADGLRISLRSFFEFAGSQLGVLTPFICVLIAIALWKMKRSENEEPLCKTPGSLNVKSSSLSDPLANPLASNGEWARYPFQAAGFLFWFSVPVVVFFLLKSLQGKVQANWAMMGYITGIIAFSATFLTSWERHKRYLKVAIIVGVILSSVVTAVAHYPLKFHVPKKLDPSSRLRGWKELGSATDSLCQGAKLKGEPFVFSDSYQVASELAFYMRGHPVTYCVNLGRRMNQYDLWPEFDNRMHSDAIFVTIGDAGLSPGIRDAFGDHTKYLYKVYEKGNLLREYSLFVCRDFRGMKKELIRSY